MTRGGAFARLFTRKTAPGKHADKPSAEKVPFEQKKAIMGEFYRQSQHNPDPLAREIAWRVYNNMRKDLNELS